MEAQMSTHAYYSSGERNEQGEWERPEVGSFARTPQPEIVYPKEFDFEYFKSERDKFGHYSQDYWEWEAFRIYCKATSALLKQTAFEFCKKYSIKIEELNLPSFIDGSLQPESFELLKENMQNAEVRLFKQFDKSNRTIQARLTKNKTLQKLVNYAAKTWVMCYALEGNYFSNALNYKKAVNNFDLDNDVELLRAFRATLIMKRRSDKIKPNLIIDKEHQRIPEIYSKVDARAIYNELAISVGVLQLTDYDNILSDLEPRMQPLRSNKIYAHLIYFYENYDFIKWLIINMNRIVMNYNSTSFDRCGVFQNVEGFNGDIYEKAESVLQVLQIIKDNVSDPILINDVDKMEQDLIDCLENAKEVHYRSTL